MLVLRSLYEEEITGEQMDAFFNTESHSESFAEAASFAPDPLLALGPDEYLEHLAADQERRRHPRDGVAQRRDARRLDLATRRLIEQAGADGLELHIYHAASDMTTSAAEVERQAVEIVREVKRSLRIPVAVKLAPLLTAFAHFAKQLDDGGRRRARALHALPPRRTSTSRSSR